MSKSCLSCTHKDVCLARTMFIFNYFIVPERYNEVAIAKETVDIGVDCKNWQGKDPEE